MFTTATSIHQLQLEKAVTSLFPSENIFKLFLFLFLFFVFCFLFFVFCFLFLFFFCFCFFVFLNVVDVISNARKESAIKNPETGSYLEYDAWVPSLSLGFEFQV
jgi:hypothetical protein